MIADKGETGRFPLFCGLRENLCFTIQGVRPALLNKEQDDALPRRATRITTGSSCAIKAGDITMPAAAQKYPARCSTRIVIKRKEFVTPPLSKPPEIRIGRPNIWMQTRLIQANNGPCGSQIRSSFYRNCCAKRLSDLAFFIDDAAGGEGYRNPGTLS